MHIWNWSSNSSDIDDASHALALCYFDALQMRSIRIQNPSFYDLFANLKIDDLSCSWISRMTMDMYPSLVK